MLDPTRHLLYREQKIPLWFWIGISTVMIMAGIALYPLAADGFEQILERRRANLSHVAEEPPVTVMPQPTIFAPRPTPLPLIAAIPPTSPPPQPPASPIPVTVAEPTATPMIVAAVPTSEPAVNPAAVDAEIVANKAKEWGVDPEWAASAIARGIDIGYYQTLEYEVAAENGVCPDGYALDYAICVNMFKAPPIVYDRTKTCDREGELFLISIQSCVIPRPKLVNPEDPENPAYTCPDGFRVPWDWMEEDMARNPGVPFIIATYPCVPEN